MSDAQGTPGATEAPLEPSQAPLQGPPVGEPQPSEPPALPSGKGKPPKEPPAAAPGKGKPSKAKTYHEFTAKDGRKHSFESPEALNEFLLQRTMAHQDYSRKTDDLARQITRVRQREQELESQAKSNKELAEKYASFKKFMEARPETFQRFSQEVQMPPSPDEAFQRVMDAMEEKFKGFEEKLTPYSDFMEQQKFERDQEGIFNQLKEEFPELNREEVEEYMGVIAGDNVALTRAMIQALLYQKGVQPGSPEQQQKAAEAAAMKRNGRMLPGGTPPPTDQKFGSIEEAKKQFMADARASGEI